MKVSITRLLKYSALVLLSLAILMVLTTLLFSDKIKEQAKIMIDSSIDGTFEFKEAKVSFFSHFPTFSVTMNDFFLHGVPGFEKDTLLLGKELSLGVNLFSIFGNNIKINKVYANEPRISIIMDAQGKSNLFFLSQDSLKEQNSLGHSVPAPIKDSASLAGFSIEEIVIKKGSFLFRDKGSNFSIDLLNVDYKGKGRLKGDNLSLRSRIDVESLLLAYDGTNYIDKKKVSAKLLTQMNTEGMSFKLVKNKVKLEELTASFNGALDILEDGYYVNLNLSTERASLKDILSLLPSSYSSWFSNTIIEGDASANILFSGKTKEGTTLSPDLIISFDLFNGKIKSAEAPVPVEKIRLNSTIALPSLDIEQLDFKTDTLSFVISGGENKLSIQLKGFSSPFIDISGKGSANLETLSKALGLKEFYASGALNYSMLVKGLLDKPNGKVPTCDISFEYENGSLVTPYTSEKLEEITAQLNIINSTGTMAGLSISLHPLEFRFAGSPFYLDCNLENFDNLNYSLTSRGSLDLDRIALLFGVENAKIKGTLDANFDLSGNNAKEGINNLANAQGSGTLVLSKFEFSSAAYPYPFIIPNSEFNFEQEMAILKNTTVKYGSNSFKVSGYAANFINYFLTNGELSGALKLSSNAINLKDFNSIILEDSDSDISLNMNESTVVEEQTAGIVFVPKNMNLSLKTDIKQIDYESIKANNFKGEVAIANGVFFINGTGVNIAGAQFLLDAIYQPIERTKAKLEFHARADSFDIARAYREIPMVKELFATASSLEGLVSMDYSISTMLDSLMTPIYPSVKGKGFIRLEDVNVKGLKILGAVSKATGRDSLNNPNLKSVLIKTSIKNNVVTIERTRMRVFGFRPRFEGQTTLDGKLNIKMRLGLPPLGIIGIPITITGTFDNPNVQIRRGKEGDILYEQEYNSSNN